MLVVCHPNILHKHCLHFLLGVTMAPRETENNAYAKFWGDKQVVLWYVTVFSGVVNTTHSPSLAYKNKIENDPKLRKNSERNPDDDMNFC